MSIKKVVVICVVFCFWSCISLFAAERNDIYPVSMIKIISNPSFYDGKTVIVNGYLSVQSGSIFLYFDEAAYQRKDAFLKFHFSFDEKKIEIMDKSFVSVVGEFKMTDVYRDPSGYFVRVSSVDPL